MPTALYRRYRPETFADVIGQEHVTEPLMQALRTGRVNHAYLFSGPRGCGKTTSARILARCLNCEQGPTPTPCGQCDSCVGLSRGGAGTVDVIEIDAASHGGVDDARDLREKASFGPAVSRYKVYIIDEAHMVTPQGFNALLKIVEEPPEHVVFVFATTAPEKVIGTIRSRTHHYPFRLVPPARLQDYLAQLCEAEGVPVEKGVLPLVVRAGGGSVRDSLSVLDQLIAGSDQGGLTYAGAIALLGYTDGALLDDVVEAFAADDGAAVFRVVDKVVESGHEPRRFLEDLLERLRDLLVVSAVPDGAHTVLRGLPEDQLERMRQQASRFGTAQLTRAADVVSAGLTELTGATSPRLQLELICARVLLPGTEGEQGYAARLDRLERRLGAGAMSGEGQGRSGGPVEHPSAGASAGRAPAGQAQAAPAPAAQGPTAQAPAAQARAAQVPSAQVPSGQAPAAQSPSGQAQGSSAEVSGGPAGPSSPDVTSREVPAGGGMPAGGAPTGDGGASAGGTSSGGAASAGPTTPTASAAGPGGVDLETIRRVWPDVVERLAGMRRVTWMMVRDHATVASFDGRRLVLALGNPGVLANFRSGAHGEFVQQALIDVLGVEAQVDVTGGDAAPEMFSRPAGAAGGAPGRSPAEDARPAPASAAEPSSARAPSPAGDWSAPEAAAPERSSRERPSPERSSRERSSEPSPSEPPAPEPPGWDDPGPEPEPDGWDEAPRTPPSAAGSPVGGSSGPSPDAPSTGQSPIGQSSAGQSSAGQSSAGQPVRPEPPSPAPPRVAPGMDEPSPDDLDVEDSGLVGRAVVEQLLGGRVIDETDA